MRQHIITLPRQHAIGWRGEYGRIEISGGILGDTDFSERNIDGQADIRRSELHPHGILQKRMSVSRDQQTSPS